MNVAFDAIVPAKDTCLEASTACMYDLLDELLKDAEVMAAIVGDIQISAVLHSVPYVVECVLLMVVLL